MAEERRAWEKGRCCVQVGPGATTVRDGTIRALSSRVAEEVLDGGRPA
jgi:hypothetical protein